MLRSQFRAEGVVRTKAKFVSDIPPPPPICNRVAVAWKEPCKFCFCSGWPQYLADNLCKADYVVPIDECVDLDGVLGKPSEDKTCQYWRPTGSKGRKWWYNGKVDSMYRVRYPTGATKYVVGLN